MCIRDRADAGLAGQIPVIGIDGIDAAKESVEAGELNATILQDVQTIGEKTVEVAIAMAKGEDVEDVYNCLLYTSEFHPA